MKITLWKGKEQIVVLSNIIDLAVVANGLEKNYSK